MVATCEGLEGNSQPPRLQRETEENDGAVSSAHTRSARKLASSTARPVMSSFFCLSVFKALPVTWPCVHIERVCVCVCISFHSSLFLCTFKLQQYCGLNNVIIDAETNKKNRYIKQGKNTDSVFVHPATFFPLSLLVLPASASSVTAVRKWLRLKTAQP